MQRRAFISRFAAAALLASLLASGSAAAQPYPNRPITLVVPFPPGGATDAIARTIQDSMSQSLGQQIVIENIGGAGGMIAAARAARAAPDGYTVLLHQVALAAGMTLYPNLGFNAEKDFVTVGLINTAASTLAARATLPPNNIDELVRWMKAPEQNAKIAHAGVGSFGHLAGVLVAQEIGAAAVVAGPLVKGGKLKAYAIIGRNRFAGLPDLPTMGEVGYKKLDLDFWHMLLVPAGTPAPIVERLNAALRDALADARVRKTFADGGMDVFPGEEQTPDAARALLKREVKLWNEAIRANNITAQ